MLRRLLITALLFVSTANAMEWQQLDKMRMAIQQQNYRGEYIHRRGDTSNAYSIVHQFKDGQGTELLRQLDGDMIEVVRTNDQVTCYLPKGSESALNHAVPAAPFSQVSQLSLDRIASNYKAMKVGSERVAGYQADIIELAGDEWRYRQRLWLERDTMLLLQSELVDEQGQVLEQFRFTRLELGVPIDQNDLVPSLKGKENVLQQSTSIEMPEASSDKAFDSTLEWLPAGYQLTHAEHKAQSQGWLEQRTYSDGLTSFSVFIELKRDADLSQSALAKMGATTALMTLKGDLSITVIGEIPNSTARRIAQMVTTAATL